MGYPSHLTDVAKNGLKCNVHGDEVDRMVSESPEVVLMQLSNLQLHVITVRFLLYHTFVRQRSLLSG